MDKHQKLTEKIIFAQSDANIDFDDLCQLLVRLGFVERVRGSHHIFRKAGVEERINLQCDGASAKRYQVKQVRELLLKYRLRDLL